jgi:hypothetical protein
MMWGLSIGRAGDVHRTQRLLLPPPLLSAAAAAAAAASLSLPQMLVDFYGVEPAFPLALHPLIAPTHAPALVAAAAADAGELLWC